MRWFIVSATAVSVWTFAAGLAAGGDRGVSDPVIDRLRQHVGFEHGLTLRVIGDRDLPAHLWSRVQHLVAFRLHRRGADGVTRVDPEIYVVRTSAVYRSAERVLRSSATTQEYVWCQLAAVVAHEVAHTAPLTERQALAAEAAQLERCLYAGHLATNNGWDALRYLGKVRQRMKKPREHY